MTEMLGRRTISTITVKKIGKILVKVLDFLLVSGYHSCPN